MTTSDTETSTAASVISPAALSPALKQSVLRLARTIRGQRAEKDITNGQFAALSELIAVGRPISLTDLSQRERVSPPAMNRHLTALVDHGYAIRTRSTKDQRVVYFKVSDKGISLYDKTHLRRDAWLRGELETLSAEELEILAKASSILELIASR